MYIYGELLVKNSMSIYIIINSLRKKQKELFNNKLNINELAIPYDGADEEGKIRWWFDHYNNAKRELKELDSLDSSGLNEFISNNNKIIEARKLIINNMIERDAEIITEYSNYEFLNANSEVFRKSMENFDNSDNRKKSIANLTSSIIGSKISIESYKVSYDKIINESKLSERNKKELYSKIAKMPLDSIVSCEQAIELLFSEINQARDEIIVKEKEVRQFDGKLLEINNEINKIDKEIFNLDKEGNNIAVELQTLHNKVTINVYNNY